MKTKEIIVNEGIRTNAAIAALLAALTYDPAMAQMTDNPMQHQEPEAQEQVKKAGGVALTIFRAIKNVKELTSAGMKEEARVEFNNILRHLQGMPNQSKTYPIVKDMLKDKTI